MSLIDQARLDIASITSDLGGFGVSAIFTSPLGVLVSVPVLHTKHHLSVDTDGNKVNSKNAHLSVAESNLIAALYPIRNAYNEVNLKGHKVTIKDSTGLDCTYMIREWFPNETTGLIVCVLADFE